MHNIKIGWIGQPISFHGYNSVIERKKSFSWHQRSWECEKGKPEALFFACKHWTRVRLLLNFLLWHEDEYLCREIQLLGFTWNYSGLHFVFSVAVTHRSSIKMPLVCKYISTVQLSFCHWFSSFIMFIEISGNPFPLWFGPFCLVSGDPSEVNSGDLSLVFVSHGLMYLHLLGT